MASPHRLQIKLFFDEGSSLGFDAFVPVFHRWIQRRAVEDLLIDIHNYSHIANGPGILLVGHEGDYAIEESGSRRGLIYRLKRGDQRSLAEAMAAAGERALKAVDLLERDTALKNKVRLSRTELEIKILDRLRFPNDASGAAAAEQQLSSVIRAAMAGGTFSLERIDNDPREPLAVRVSTSAAPDFASLSESVSAAGVD